MIPPKNGPSGGQTGENDVTPRHPPESARTQADVFSETGMLPEDYVVKVIETNGGRLKQQTICDITGWSNSSISRILSELQDDGRIHRVWIGRQKVVCLPGQTEELLDLTAANGEGQ